MKRLIVAIIVLLLLLGVSAVLAKDQKNANESGEFIISMAGKVIGEEKYEIVLSGEAAASTSILEFQNPSNDQKIQFETRLEMNANYLPQKYLLKSNVGGKKGSITGEFAPNQVMFQYSSESGPGRKSGLLVGNKYTLLDTNVFHHFIFLARLFNYNDNKPQRFEVVILQEQESGVLSITLAGKETLIVHNKKTETRRLRVDTGSVQINLWVDNQKILQKISVPDKGLEVIRKS
jgi:hypothetical protein